MMQDWADRLDQWEQEGTQNGQTDPAPNLPEKPVQPLPDRQPHNVLELSDTPTPVMTILARKEQRPQPMLTDIQRQRAKQLETFEAAHNLPLPAFARLAGKSRDQITRDIKAGRLLALSLGNRGQRLPDWQLDPDKAPLIQHILIHTQGTDPWNLYQALTEPREEKGGAVIDQLTAQNLKTLTLKLCRQLQLN